MTKPITAVALLAASLLASGCASRSDRIAAALMDYGVPKQPARCVARELDDRLSDRQLGAINNAISNAKRAASSDRPAELIGKALDALRDGDDSEVVGVAMRAGVACSLMG
jgi:hypothetical protein